MITRSISFDLAENAWHIWWRSSNNLMNLKKILRDSVIPFTQYKLCPKVILQKFTRRISIFINETIPNSTNFHIFLLNQDHHFFCEKNNFVKNAKKNSENSRATIFQLYTYLHKTYICALLACMKIKTPTHNTLV